LEKNQSYGKREKMTNCSVRVPASVKRDLEETVLVPDRRLQEYQISSRFWKVLIKLEKLFLDRIETE
jgi:hypothetical protein